MPQLQGNLKVFYPKKPVSHYRQNGRSASTVELSRPRHPHLLEKTTELHILYGNFLKFGCRFFQDGPNAMS